MQSLRRRRHLARPLAAWLLLWFVFMAASAYRGPALPLADGGEHHPHALQAADAHEDCGEDHAQADDAPVQHTVHCPLCMHAAAPPSQLAQTLPAALPSPRLRTPGRVPVPRVQGATPPPARGPPAFS